MTRGVSCKRASWFGRRNPRAAMALWPDYPKGLLQLWGQGQKGLFFPSLWSWCLHSGQPFSSDPPPFLPWCWALQAWVGRKWEGGGGLLCSFETKVCGPSSMFRNPIPTEILTGWSCPLKTVWPDGLGLEPPWRSLTAASGSGLVVVKDRILHSFIM